MNDCFKQPNGRVNILTPNMADQFAMYDKIPINKCTDYNNALTGIWQDTMLSNIFFSADNIRSIQSGLINGVYILSKEQFVISPQDCDILKTIMRSIYLQYAVNLPTEIQQQVNILNKKVLDFCIPEVYKSAKSYMQYRHDISTLAVPMQRPVSTYESQTLEFKSFF